MLESAPRATLIGRVMGVQRWFAAFVGIVVAVGTGPAAGLATSPPPEPLWMTKIRGSSGSTYARLDVGRSGVTYVTGDASNPSRMFLTAVGPDATVRWRRTWKPSFADEDTWAFGTAVQAAPDGSVYVGGVMGRPAPVGHWFLARYAADGSLLWRQTRAGWRKHPYPGSGIGAIATTARGAVVALNAGGCCDDGFAEGRLRAYTPDGEVLWTRNIEVPGVPIRNTDTVVDVAVEDGAIYLAGTVNRLPGRYAGEKSDLDVFVQRRTMQGALVWSRLFGRTGTGLRAWDCASSLSVLGRRLVLGANLRGCRAGPNESLGWVGRFGLRGGLHRTWRWHDAWVGDVSLAPSKALYATTSDGLARIDPDGTRAWLAVLQPDLRGASVDAVRRAVSVVTTRPAGAMNLWRFRDSR